MNQGQLDGLAARFVVSNGKNQFPVLIVELLNDFRNPLPELSFADFCTWIDQFQLAVGCGPDQASPEGLCKVDVEVGAEGGVEIATKSFVWNSSTEQNVPGGGTLTVTRTRGCCSSGGNY